MFFNYTIVCEIFYLLTIFAYSLLMPRPGLAQVESLLLVTFHNNHFHK